MVATAQSTILYGAAAWKKRATHKGSIKKLNSAYRMLAKKTCCAYRTVSTEAVGVIAGLLPLDLAAKEIATKAESNGVSKAKSDADRRNRLTYNGKAKG